MSHTLTRESSNFCGSLFLFTFLEIFLDFTLDSLLTDDYLLIFFLVQKLVGFCKKIEKINFINTKTLQ